MSRSPKPSSSADRRCAASRSSGDGESAEDDKDEPYADDDADDADADDDDDDADDKSASEGMVRSAVADRTRATAKAMRRSNASNRVPCAHTEKMKRKKIQ